MQRDDWTSIRSVALVGLGVLLGVVALYVPSLISETDPEVAVRPGDTAASSELNRRMVLLEEAIRELNQSIALLVEFPALATRFEPTDASIQRTELAPADAMPATDRVALQTPPDPKKLDWSTAVSRRLREALVEYGLTPYDPGVNRILPEAAGQIREASAEWSRQWRELHEQRDAGIIDRLTFDRAKSDATLAWNARRDEIAAAFRENVKMLALE